MASDLISTTKYETNSQNLTGGAWSKGQNCYISVDKMLVTNNSALAFTNAAFGSNGIIGTVREVPDLTVAGDRMVIDLVATLDQKTALKLLLRGTEL